MNSTTWPDVVMFVILVLFVLVMIHGWPWKNDD